MPVADLIPYAKNSRLHTPAQIKLLRASIQEFGWTMPVLIDEDNGIIAGHGRVIAAQMEGIATVPCLVARGWTEAQRRAYVIADNRLTDLSTFDDDILREELSALSNLDFSFEALGFTQKEMDGLLASLPGMAAPELDAVPDTAPQVCAPGDVWRLGAHLLTCGDCTDPAVVAKLFTAPGGLPDLILTDPPYGVPILTNFKLGKRGARKSDGKKFRAVIGNDEAFNPAHLLTTATPAILWGANHYAHHLPGNGRWLVWDKREDIIPQRTQADCELAWCSDYGAARIFRHYWDGMMKASERGEARVHPTQKPVALMQWCMDFVPKCKIVYDPYGGSGTTLIAAENTGRSCRMIEIDPLYCDIIIRRWQDLTGKPAQKVK